MHLVIGLLLLLIAFAGNAGEKQKIDEKVKKRRLRNGTDESYFIDPWEEYVIHCGNVAKVNQMIAEEEAKTVVTDSDIQFVHTHVPYANLYTKDMIKPYKVVGNVWLKVFKGERMPLDFMVTPEQRRNQMAYYLTLDYVIQNRGKKTQMMYHSGGWCVAILWNHRNEPDYHYHMKRIFGANHHEYGSGGYVHTFCGGRDGIQYPIHDHPHMDLKPYFWNHRLQDATWEETEEKYRP